MVNNAASGKTPLQLKKQRILERLNEQQQAVATDYTGLAVVSAGPGAGNSFAHSKQSRKKLRD
jgi:hypothetical protein